MTVLAERPTGAAPLAISAAPPSLAPAARTTGVVVTPFALSYWNPVGPSLSVSVVTG